MDSMVNHYTVSHHHRKTDAFTPGGVGGKEELSFGGIDFYMSSYISQFYIIHGVSPPVFFSVVFIIGKGVGQKPDSSLFTVYQFD